MSTHPASLRVERRTLSHSYAIACIGPDRAPLNLLTPAMAEGMLTALRQAIADPHIVGIVISGGFRLLGSGWDARALLALTPRQLEQLDDTMAELLSTLAHSSTPTVCHCANYAVGPYAQIALACQASIAGDNAKVWVPAWEYELGMLGDRGTCAGDTTWMATDRFLDAHQAHRAGVFTTITAPDEAENQACAWAEHPDHKPARPHTEIIGHDTAQTRTQFAQLQQEQPLPVISAWRASAHQFLLSG